MNWYKGNLHTHTTLSDGVLSPDEIADLYGSRGYDFLALTDHWKLSETKLHRSGILLLSGVEYDFGRNVREGIFHIVAVGFEKDPCVTRDMTPEEAIARIHAAGGLADIAHPAWSMNTVGQLKRTLDADYTEIFNSVSDFPANCRPYSGDVLDKLAADEGGRLFPLAAVDDTHWCAGEECRSFIYVRAEACTPSAIAAAMRRGDFYASQGPMIEVTYVGGRVSVVCREEDEITAVVYFTDTAWDSHRCDVAKDGERLVRSEYCPTGRETYVRVEAVSAKGLRAWSRYVRLK